MSILAQNSVLRTVLETHLPTLIREEGLSADAIVAAIEAGSMVLLGNPAHPGVVPVLVGQPARVKVNANIGTSPFQNHPACEMRKLAVAREAGADTVMDLSIAGDLAAIRREMLNAPPSRSEPCQSIRWRNAALTRIATLRPSIPRNCLPKWKCRPSRAWTS